MRMLPLAAILLTFPMCAVLAESNGTAVLPFHWKKAWPGQVEKSALLNPVSDAVKVDVKMFLQAPPLPNDEEKARDKTIEDMIAPFKELNEPLPRHVNDPFVPKIQGGPRVGPSVIADPAVALVLLAIGAVGWIGLAVGAYCLERRGGHEST